jgi:hypothetical protein
LLRYFSAINVSNSNVWKCIEVHKCQDGDSDSIEGLTKGSDIAAASLGFCVNVLAYGVISFAGSITQVLPPLALTRHLGHLVIDA